MVMEGNHPEANVAVSGGMADWGGRFLHVSKLFNRPPLTPDPVPEPVLAGYLKSTFSDEYCGRVIPYSFR